MSRLCDAVGDYCASEHFFLLDDGLKDQAESLLAHWCEQVGERPTHRDVRDALGAVGRLDVPVEARRGFPRLLHGFLEYVSSNTPIDGADGWCDVVARAEEGYLDSFREDGTVRGETVRHGVAGVGRNDPCPCGSGRKFKKCCMPR